jgi:tetratricopeptide (TPR) repeat protein
MFFRAGGRVVIALGLCCRGKGNSFRPGVSFLLLELTAWWFVVGMGLLPAAAQQSGTGQVPIYEQEAYDLITLTAEAGGTTLKVLPLPLPGRRVPQPFPKTGSLQFRLVDEPDVLYEVPWPAVAKIELFHDLVLAEAKRLAEEGRFEEAFDHFLYLKENDPDLPGFAEAFNEFLFREARWHQAGGRHERALAIFTTLYSRHRDYPGLADAMAQSFDHQLQQAFASENFSGARRLLQALAKFFPNHPVAQSWEQRLIGLAQSALEQAREAAAKQAFSEAHRRLRRALEIWPRLQGAFEFAAELHRQYPRVVVAVSQPVPQDSLNPLSHWASRRVYRLVARTLFEFAGPSLEGGQYLCPFGQGSWDPYKLQLLFSLRPGVRGVPSGEELTSFRLAQELFRWAAGEGSPEQKIWNQLLGSVECTDLYTLEVRLTRLHLRPEALLVFPLEFSSPVLLAAAEGNGGAGTDFSMVTVGTEGNSGKDLPLDLPDWARRSWIGPYRLVERTEEFARFEAKPEYFAADERQPREIVEVSFRSPLAALRALRSGEVDIVDRVPPWLVEEVSQVQGLVVEPYALPTLHCLLPNMDRPLLRRAAFRRGLLYGLNRQAILERLLGGTKQQAARVVSGPFLAATGSGEPLDYAYDSTVAPKPYDPRLAIALLQVAFAEWTAELPEEKRPQRIPELALAFVEDPIARFACEAIRNDWRRLGLRVELRPLEAIAPPQVPEDVDLLYLELAVWEPAVDVERIFCPEGLCGYASPHMMQALARLRTIREWNEMALQLRRIHRLVDLQCSILPLWQLGDYFARAHSLEGVGSRPFTLYQNVERWRFTPRPFQFEL